MKRPILILALATVFASLSTHAFAQSTIMTRICNDTQAATITITSPASDSLVDRSTITLRGAVSQSNQLEVFVDDAFNSVVPLASGATTYSADVQLSPGTHKVTIAAIDACQVENNSRSIVVSYQPAQMASTGSEVPTGVNEDIGAIGAQESIGDSMHDQVSPSVVERLIRPVYNSVVDSLDLQSPHGQSIESQGLTNMNRFMMTLGGLSLVFTAGPIATFIGNNAIISVDNALKWRATVSRITRVIGVGLIALMFIL
jgi:hypothetical protein